MTFYLKQSTASQEVPLGPFVDSTDGVTAETALTIANTDIKMWKSGATTLADKNSGGATHISGGIYYAVLDATDTDTLGPLKLFVAVAGALACVLECVVLAANVYDSLIGGGDLLQVETTALGANAITATAIAADAGAEIADAVWDEALSGHQTAGTAGRNATLAASVLGEFTLTGTPTSTVLRISGGSAVNDYYNDLQLIITSGALVGQARPISDYDGATGDITVDEAFTSAPAAGVTVAILASHAHPVTQIQSGLATAAALDAVDNFVDTEVAAILAAVDTEVAAIKVQTDKLTFTVANQLDANVQYVNDVQVSGNGETGTEWGPA